MAYGLGEVHEPVAEGPFRYVAVDAYAESEIGRRSTGRQCCVDLVCEFRPLRENQFDLLTAPLLEAGDGILERLILSILSLSHHTMKSAAVAPTGARTSAAAIRTARPRMTQPP
jgi:hypothetical protein